MIRRIILPVILGTLLHPQPALAQRSTDQSGRITTSGIPTSGGTLTGDLTLTCATCGIVKTATQAGRGPLFISMGTAADPVLVFGYNHTPQYTTNVANEPGVAWMIEGNYDDGSGQNKAEAYLQYLWPDGSGKYSRTFAFQWNRVTNLPAQTALSGAATGGVALYFNEGAGAAGSEQFVLGTKMLQVDKSGFDLLVPIIASLTQKYGAKAGATTHMVWKSNDAANDFRLSLSRSIAGAGAYWALQAEEAGVDYRDIYLQPSGGAVKVGGQLTSTGTATLGWSIVAVANTACTTTCTSACVAGQDTGAANKPLVGCADATADLCICAGAN
jgi:hypothetical protein